MGNRGFTSSALAHVASFRDRLANPVFHVKPPATAPSLDALTPASSHDHQDSTHYPVSDRDSARPPAEGDHTRVPVHTRPVPRRRTHQRTHRGPPTPPMNPRPRSLDVSLSTDPVHISTSTIVARHCQLRHLPAQTLVSVYIEDLWPSLLAGVAPTPGTGMHSRPVPQAPPSGPFYSDESQQSTTPLTPALAHADDRPPPHPFGDTTARAPLSLPIPCTSPTASRADRGGGEWRPDAAPGLLDGCILGAATHPSGGAGTDRALHGRARPPRRSPRVAQLPRSTSTQGVPPARIAAVAAARPCRHRGGGGSVSDGSGRPRAPLPIVPLRRHHARTTETVVSRETRTSIVPSDSACLPIPHLSGRTHAR